jgi:hypothetical protein
MKKLIVSFHLCAVLFSSAFAQTIINRNSEIENMVQEISKELIEQNVRTLMNFHTRHNLSEQNNPTQGIGAAWNCP